MTEPQPTRPDPGETQYGSRRPPPVPDPHFPDPGRYEDEHTWWGRRRRRRLDAELEQQRLEVARLDVLEEIIWLEHSTKVVPLGSDPAHCCTCARIAARLAWLRKEHG